MRRVGRRLLPFLFVLYIVNYLDRTNVSIAALQMNSDLHFSSAVFGFGAGIFFIGYALFEVPSSLVLTRVGARRWIARIMITWGLLAISMMWVRTPQEFYTVRFLLGVAEAGFFPGVIYYLKHWFPEHYRCRATARFTIAIPIAQAVSGALGGGLLQLDGMVNLSGWQWLFLVEGLPSVMLGAAVLWYLTDQPIEARWLGSEEQKWLSFRLEQERLMSTASIDTHALMGLRNPVTWLLAFGYFAYFTVAFAYTSWGPLLIREAFGTTNLGTGSLTAAVAVFATLFYLLVAAKSDASGDRCLYAAIGCAIGCLGCVGAALTTTAMLKMAWLAILPISSAVFLPSFFCLPARLVGGSATAATIAFVNAVGSTGGFLGPYLVGFFKDAGGGDRGAFLILGGLGMAGCMLFLALRQVRAFGRLASNDPGGVAVLR